MDVCQGDKSSLNSQKRFQHCLEMSDFSSSESKLTQLILDPSRSHNLKPYGKLVKSKSLGWKDKDI